MTEACEYCNREDGTLYAWHGDPVLELVCHDPRSSRTMRYDAAQQ